MNAFDKNLRRLRIRRNLKQEDLAELVHVTRQTVSGWETGRRQPDLQMLQKLAEALDADVHELIYGTKEEAAKWIDIESFERVVGRSDLPGYVETNLTAYGEVSKALSEPIMQCINGEITPEACMKAALDAAEEALADAE